MYDELFTTCVGGTLPDHGLPEGAHQGTLTVWLPNVKDPLPPVSFSFSTSCAGVAALSDGGVPGSDGATSGDGRNSDADDSRTPSPDGDTIVTLSDASTNPDAEAVDAAPVSSHADGSSPPPTTGPIDSNSPDTELATAVDAGTKITKADAGTNGADAANQSAGRGKSGCDYVGSPASGGVTSLLVLLGLACVLCRRTRGVT